VPGEYEVRAEFSVDAAKTKFDVGVAGQSLAVEVESTGGYGKYLEKILGTINIGQAGDHTLRVKPDAPAWEPMNLRRIELQLKTYDRP